MAGRSGLREISTGDAMQDFFDSLGLPVVSAMDRLRAGALLAATLCVVAMLRGLVLGWLAWGFFGDGSAIVHSQHLGPAAALGVGGLGVLYLLARRPG